MIIKTYTSPTGNSASLSIEFNEYNYPKTYTLKVNTDTATIRATRANAKVITRLYERAIKDFEEKEQ